jgi:hypothetical protein
MLLSIMQMVAAARDYPDGVKRTHVEGAAMVHYSYVAVMYTISLDSLCKRITETALVDR